MILDDGGLDGRRRGKREKGDEPVSKLSPDSTRVWRIRGLTWDVTAEPVSRDQILKAQTETRKIHCPCSADHEQDL